MLLDWAHNSRKLAALWFRALVLGARCRCLLDSLIKSNLDRTLCQTRRVSKARTGFVCLFRCGEFSVDALKP